MHLKVDNTYVWELLIGWAYRLQWTVNKHDKRDKCALVELSITYVLFLDC